MSSLIRCAAALVLAGALSGVCFAQDQGPDQGQPGQTQSDQGQPGQSQSEGGRHGGHHGGALRAACEADIAKLCSGDDAQRPFRCLRDHQDSVSDSCKSAMATARAERQARGGGQPGGWSRGGGPDNNGGSPDGMAPSNDAQPQH